MNAEEEAEDGVKVADPVSAAVAGLIVCLAIVSIIASMVFFVINPPP